MKHINKFNEHTSIEDLTWGDVLKQVESNRCKLIGLDKEDFIEKYKMEDPTLKNGRFISRGQIKNGCYNNTRNGCVIVFDEQGLPVAVIEEYELINPFVFGDVVVCPGHDSITCYNKFTGEHVTEGIR